MSLKSLKSDEKELSSNPQMSMFEVSVAFSGHVVLAHCFIISSPYSETQAHPVPSLITTNPFMIVNAHIWQHVNTVKNQRSHQRKISLLRGKYFRKRCTIYTNGKSYYLGEVLSSRDTCWHPPHRMPVTSYLTCPAQYSLSH